MSAVVKTEAKARTFGRNIESDLASRFLRVVETAAIASAHTMGQGERKLSDQVATEAMRKTMDSIPMRGTIVIGEGERDEAPMLYIGEKVGAEFPDGTEVPEVDIAVDPLRRRQAIRPRPRGLPARHGSLHRIEVCVPRRPLTRPRKKKGSMKC
jgi:hypothetical protein